MSQLYKHYCVIFTTAPKRGILIPSSQRRGRQFNQRQQKAEPFPTQSLLRHSRVRYQNPLHFHRTPKVSRPMGKAAHHAELSLDVSPPPQESRDSRTTLEDTVVQSCSEFRKETRASNLKNLQGWFVYGNVCPDRIHVSWVVPEGLEPWEPTSQTR